MNIKEFKLGDIITRNELITYEHNGSADNSYCGDRMVFKGNDIESKIIFVENKDHEILDLSYARDNWDEGWCMYPEKMYKKLIKKI